MEARATELMETEDVYDEPSIEMYDDAPSTQKGEMEDMECDKYDAISNSQGSSSQEGVVWIQDVHCKDSSIFDAPSTSQGTSSHQGDRFGDITLMISRWETQEKEEDTPVVEMVRKRRRSGKLDKIVRDLNLESDVDIFIPEQSMLKNSSGSFISIFQSKNNTKPEPKQIVSLCKSKRSGGKKRKFETDLDVDFGRNEAKRRCGSC